MKSGATISMDKLRQWMSSRKRRLRSSAYYLVSEHPERIESYSVDEADAFRLAYLEQCLCQDAEHPDLVDRLQAAHELSIWFRELWRERQRGSEAIASRLERIRDLLARVCRQGSRQQREAVVLGALEHLFQDAAIVEFFGQWEHDPALAGVFAEALDLATN